MDSCGYTCLHHAALNGHKDIVELLLTLDANPNLVDNRGSSALHLSAWTGDNEIVDMLLTKSAHVPNINLKNNDMDTALHFAAQYGHTSVVSLLLQSGADAMCRNLKDESALDLAAQYGRTDTVELLLRTRPSLARHLTGRHSPLHLAARNGHRTCVKLLIDARFDVNYCTDTGSALHEAALFGKLEVCRLLLKAGIHTDLEDSYHRTVVDILVDLNTPIAKQTVKLIREHSLLSVNNTDTDGGGGSGGGGGLLSYTSSSHCISPPPGYTDNTPEHQPYGYQHNHDIGGVGGGGIDGKASPAMTSASEFSYYEPVPPPAPRHGPKSVRSSTGSEDNNNRLSKPRLSRSRDSILDGYSTTASSRSPSYLDYEIPPPLPPRHFLHNDDDDGYGDADGHMDSGNGIASSSLGRIDDYSTGNNRNSHTSSCDTAGSPVVAPLVADDYGQLLVRRHRHHSSHQNSNNNTYDTQHLDINPSRPDSQSSMASSSNRSSYGRTTTTSTTGANGLVSVKPIPPMKPPRKSISPVNRSLTINTYDYSTGSYSSRQQQHDRTLTGRNCHNNNNNNFCDNNTNTTNDSEKFNEIKRRLIEESDFSKLYDQIANGSASPILTTTTTGGGSTGSPRPSSDGYTVGSVDTGSIGGQQHNNNNIRRIKPSGITPYLRSKSELQSTSSSNKYIYETITTATTGADDDDEANGAADDGDDSTLKAPVVAMHYMCDNGDIYAKPKRSTVQIPVHCTAPDSSQLLLDNNNRRSRCLNGSGGGGGTGSCSIGGQSTPDYEPPSPTTALNGIHAVIQPLCQEYKRVNGNNHYHNHNNLQHRDIETLTEEQLFASLDSSGYVRLSLRNGSFNSSSSDNNNNNKRSVAVSTDINGCIYDLKFNSGLTIGANNSNNNNNRRSVVSSDNHIKRKTNSNNNNINNNKTSVYHNYCETLKLDRSGEKENPFAGLCRGSVTNSTGCGGQTSTVRRRDGTSIDGNQQKKSLLRRQRNFNCCDNTNNIYSTLKRTKHKQKAKSMDNSGTGGGTGSIAGAGNGDHHYHSGGSRSSNAMKIAAKSTTTTTTTTGGNHQSFDDLLSAPSIRTTTSSTDDNNSRISSRLSGSPLFDENHEWAEIARIMDSFGSTIGRDNNTTTTTTTTTTTGSSSGGVVGGLTHNFSEDMDKSFSSCLSKESSSTDFEEQSVEEWLSRIGLSEYSNLLIVNGFDNVLYMGSNVMDDTDLLEIGVTNASHRDRILLEAKQRLPIVRQLTADDVQQVSVDQWLLSLKLYDSYGQSFAENGYTEMSRVRNLWEVELNTVLEINRLGHRKRILASLGERLRLIEDLGLDDLDFDKLNLNISQLSVDEGLDTCSSTMTATSLSTNASIVGGQSTSRTGQQQSETPKTTTTTTTESNKQQSDSSRTGSQQWKHTNRELIDSSCKYTASYLGSTLVRELRGIDSTRASIQKLRQSTKTIGKIPQIILSISYKGVQFIDAVTQVMVCEHSIRNIQCICQDSEDLNHFAYITKELETNNHYCHVFSSNNTDLVTDVILTLGQAFEIAYQMLKVRIILDAMRKLPAAPLLATTTYQCPPPQQQQQLKRRHQQHLQQQVRHQSYPRSSRRHRKGWALQRQHQLHQQLAAQYRWQYLRYLRSSRSPNPCPPSAAAVAPVDYRSPSRRPYLSIRV
ncbi:ankyrin repeat and SAM domain-containing protein 1A-like isoform X2 [Oppia nitens]|nr:ankyrin repeat and SAM domain-containing protein 1A-like isoform X2 [Oppia nitens]